MKIIGYKTVNEVNGKFYYGVRKLRSKKDPYIGSGLRLLEAVKKYGRDKFTRFDLVEFSNMKKAFEWESKIVTQKLVDDPNCYNLKRGGYGGGEPWSEDKKRYHKNKGTYKKSIEIKQKMSKSALKRFEDQPGTFTGKSHTEESKIRMSNKQKGRPGRNKGKTLKLSEERKKELKISCSRRFKGISKSEEHKQRMSKSMSNNPANSFTQLLTCPYCGKEGQKPNLLRWHFTNCKEYKN